MMVLSPRQQVITTVNKWIEDRTLQPDVELPSENSLAETINVARGTVRSGISVLLEHGVLIKKGRKIYVASTASNNGLLKRTVVMIGMSDPDAALKLQNTGYIAAIQGGAISTAARLGIPALCLDFSHLRVRDIEEVCRNQAAGVMLFQSQYEPADFAKMVRLLESNQVPTVTADDHPRFASFDRVLSNHRVGGKMITAEMVRRGHRRFLALLSESRPEFWVRERLAGYAEGLQGASEFPIFSQAEIPMIAEYKDWSETEFKSQVRYIAGCLVEFFTKPENIPDVILAKTDWDVPVIAAAVRLFGHDPGRDVTICGYDNKYKSCNWSQFESYLPELTVNKENSLTGQRMMEVLNDRINGRLSNAPTLNMVDPVLVIPEKSLQ